MVYHVVNKSIADFTIFNDCDEFQRMLLAIRYYKIKKQPFSLSRFLEIHADKQIFTNSDLYDVPKNNNEAVKIIAYCLMPTHLHIMLKELESGTMSKFINDVLNSYTRYFNLKHGRKGPLWEGPYKKVTIQTDEQLLYVTSYIHLNPVTAYVVSRPEEWPYSSYREYLFEIKEEMRVCSFSDVLDIEPNSYRKYVEDNIAFQREIAKMKKLKLD